MAVSINVVGSWNGKDLDRARAELAKLGADAQKSIGDSMIAVGDKTAAVGKKLTTHLTLPILGAGAASVKMASDVDKGLREVVTLFGDTGTAADRTFSEMQRGVAGLSNELGIAQTTLTGGLYQAISAGVPKDNVFDFMRTASKAAVAGVTDTETAITGMTATINAFGLKTADAGKVADSMFATVKGGVTTFELLSKNIGNVAPAAAAAGVSFQEVNAALATLTSAYGGKTAEATTQLRAALVGLQKPSKDLDKIFQSVGFTNAEAAIKAKGLAFALGVVKDASGGSSGRLQQLLGSVEAVAAANVIAGTGAKKMASELENQATSAGSVADAFDVMSESNARKMETFKVSIQNLGVSIGNILLPMVNQGAEILTALASKFQNLSPEVQKTIVAIAGVAAALGPVLFVAGKTIKTIGRLTNGIEKAARTSVKIGEGLGRLASGFRSTEAASSAFSGRMGTLGGVLRHPIRSIGEVASKVGHMASTAASSVASFVASMGRAAAAAVASSARTIASFVATAAAAVASFLSAAASAVASAAAMAAAWLVAAAPFIALGVAIGVVVAVIIKYWDEIKAATLAVWEAIKTAITAVAQAIATVLTNTWNAIKAATTAVMNALKAVITGAWDAIKTVTTTVWNAIKAVITAVWGGIKAGVSAAITAVKNTITTVLDAIRNIWTNIWNGIKSFVGNIWNGIKNLVNAGVDTAKTLITNFLRGIKEIWGRTWDWFKEKVGNVWDGIINLGKAGVNGMIRVLNFMIGAVETAINFMVRAYNKVANLPLNPLPAIGEVTLGRIPGLADGGTLTASGLTLVGEEGPELLNLPRGARVTPLDQSRSINIAPGAIIVNVHGGPGTNAADVRAAVDAALNDLVRRVRSA